MPKHVTGELAERSADLGKSACNLRHKKARSEVTNHADLLPGLDGRSSAARRFRDLVSAYLADMGGLDQCSEIKLGLLRRLAATTVQAELLEARMVNGEAVDVATLCTLSSTVMRLSSRVVQELLFAAESVESSHCRGCFKEAYQLRRQAERFRASHPYPPDDYCDHLFRVYGIGGKVLARLRAERSRRIAEAAEQERELTVRPHTDAARVFGGDV